jgi:hypothetical protein
MDFGGKFSTSYCIVLYRYYMYTFQLVSLKKSFDSSRGIYFAEKSKYSDSYSYKTPEHRFSLQNPFASSTERPGYKAGEKEMFLSKLVVGNEVHMDRDKGSREAAECRALTVPPINPKTNMKYNTVTGNTGGSRVWIVYENGRAYPDYLVRYYRGNRDPARTPFASKKEAMKDSTSATSVPDGVSDDVEVGLGRGVSSVSNWAYEDNTGWCSYSAGHQAAIEDMYQAFKADATSSSKIHIDTGEWTYEVDVDAMVQINILHPGRRERSVRRL